MTILTAVAFAAISHILYDLTKGFVKVCRKIHTKRMNKKAKNVEARKAKERRIAVMASKHGMTAEEFKEIFK